MTHVFAFPLFAFSTVHVVTAGTDSANPLLRGTRWDERPHGHLDHSDSFERLAHPVPPWFAVWSR